MNTNELASIIIALIALIVSFTAIIQQLKYSIISQLSHIAGITNSYIINGEFLKDEAGISAVFSNLIISSQIIEMHYDNGMTRFWMFFINKETIKDNFYLILHTTIRDFIKKNHTIATFHIHNDVISNQIEVSKKYYTSPSNRFD